MAPPYNHRSTLCLINARAILIRVNGRAKCEKVNMMKLIFFTIINRLSMNVQISSFIAMQVFSNLIQLEMNEYEEIVVKHGREGILDCISLTLVPKVL